MEYELLFEVRLQCSMKVKDFPGAPDEDAAKRYVNELDLFAYGEALTREPEVEDVDVNVLD